MGIEIYHILDALRLVREIPAVTPDEAVTFLMGLIGWKKEDERKLLVELT
ncbi:MAG: hypothetical protein IKZ56_05575 [Bacteroidales bacterium]|nr:hypothetical protein [Bacteroidales bacterium]